MVDPRRLSEFDRLTPAEQLELAQALWDRIADPDKADLVSDQQIVEAERRLAEGDRAPSTHRTREQVRARVTAALK